jgi:hypothetical protein
VTTTPSRRVHQQRHTAGRAQYDTATAAMAKTKMSTHTRINVKMMSYTLGNAAAAGALRSWSAIQLPRHDRRALHG